MVSFDLRGEWKATEIFLVGLHLWLDGVSSEGDRGTDRPGGGKHHREAARRAILHVEPELYQRLMLLKGILDVEEAAKSKAVQSTLWPLHVLYFWRNQVLPKIP